jgi:hypothetical protein
MKNIIFTRYLYIQDEVKKALLVSILNKSEDAIFWGYELFYSGIGKKKFFKLMWNIYYDFFAILNPNFESYLLKKQKESIKNNTKLIHTIIENFLIRPFNTDVYFINNMHNIYNNKQEQEKPAKQKETILDLKYYINNKDYKSISNYILNCENDNLCYELIIDLLIELGYNLNKNMLLKNYNRLNNIRVSKKKILLSKVLTFFTNKNHKGKNIYVVIQEDEIQFKTLKVTDRIRNYRILKHSCICGINDSYFLDLFKLKRNELTNDELMNILNNNWLYYASFSRIWKKRIINYNGKIDHNNKTIIFENEELEEIFRNKYDYEPDEQSNSLKNKLIANINENNSKWIDFYNKFSNNNIIIIDINELDKNKIKF